MYSLSPWFGVYVPRTMSSGQGYVQGHDVGDIYLYVGCGCLCFLYVGIAKTLDWGAEEKIRHPTFSFINIDTFHFFSHPQALGCSRKFISSPIMEPIGTIIRDELMRQERTISWFARKLSCDRSNVYRLFQKHSIDTALLMRISVILNRDFFAELSGNLPLNNKEEHTAV